MGKRRLGESRHERLFYDPVISKYVSSAALSTASSAVSAAAYPLSDIEWVDPGGRTFQQAEYLLTSVPSLWETATHKAISGMGGKGGGQPTELGSLNGIEDESTGRQTAS
jgi:hypothetical protein